MAQAGTVRERRDVKALRDSDELLQHSLLMTLAAGVTVVFGIAFQAVVGRGLSPEEFSILASLLAVVGMTQLPLNAISTGIAHYAAILVRDRQIGTIRDLSRRWSIKMASVYLPAMALALVFAEPIAQFFHLNRTAPVVVMALVLAGVIASAMVGGILHGLQRFGWLLAGNVALSSFRVVGAALFIHLAAPAAGWALLGHGVGLAACVAVFGYAVWRTIRHTPLVADTSGILLRHYAGKSFLMLGSYAWIMHADIILVRHYLPDASGVFAYASTLAKIMILISIPMAKALFPKVVSAGTADPQQVRMLRLSLLITGGCATCAAVACTIAPGIPLTLLYKMDSPDLESRLMVTAMAWTMIPLGLINLMMYFQFAQRRFIALAPLPVGALAYLVAVTLWHDSTWQIIATLATIAVATAVALFLLLPSSVSDDHVHTRQTA